VNVPENLKKHIQNEVATGPWSFGPEKLCSQIFFVQFCIPKTILRIINLGKGFNFKIIATFHESEAKKIGCASRAREYFPHISNYTKATFKLQTFYEKTLKILKILKF
jgi:hypothetical protein